MRPVLAVVSFALFAFVMPRTWAEELVWARQLGGTSSDVAVSVAVDASGNVYSVGSFSGTADFDPGPGTFNLTSSGSGDAFVSKLDSNGNFLWAKQLGGTMNDGALDVAVDAGGNVYSVGFFAGTADFDPGPEPSDLTSAGGLDAFVSKLDGDGNFLWAQQLGGTLSDEASGMALDADGNVYSVGNFRGTVDFNPGPGVFNLSAADQDVFNSKLDSDGSFLWAKRLGGTLRDEAFGVALDAGGNVHTVGYFNGTADFDPGPGMFDLISAGGFEAFVSKLDSSGNFLWARQLGGTSGDEARGVAVDAGGNVYSVGLFGLTADFDPGPGTFNLTSGGSLDAFVSKLDSNGNFLWAQQLGGTSQDEALGVAVDAVGNVYRVGVFGLTADFDPGPGTFTLTSAGSFDAFVSKLDSNGNFLWAQQLGGTLGDAARGVAVDAGGNVYTVGSFASTADFDPGPGTFNLTSAGNSDGFVSKLGGIAAGDVFDTLHVQQGAGDDITLSWGNSCLPTDDDFAIYEGTIGSWYGHIVRQCDTGGATNATITPASGSSYYLVVPRNALREGSYGTASSGTPRPQGATGCAFQLIAQPCP